VSSLLGGVPLLNAVRISEWTPSERDTLRGFCDVHLPAGAVHHEVAIHPKGGTWWASPSSKPWLNRDGYVIRDNDGKIKYASIVSFDDKDTRIRFCSLVIAALRVAHPEVFR
jgi:hypothetical protein